MVDTILPQETSLIQVKTAPGACSQGVQGPARSLRPNNRRSARRATLEEIVTTQLQGSPVSSRAQDTPGTPQIQQVLEIYLVFLISDIFFSQEVSQIQVETSQETSQEALDTSQTQETEGNLHILTEEE